MDTVLCCRHASCHDDSAGDWGSGDGTREGHRQQASATQWCRAYSDMHGGKTGLLLPPEYVAVVRGNHPDMYVAAHLQTKGVHSCGCRLSALEELSGVEVLASDKTGALTLNQ